MSSDRLAREETIRVRELMKHPVRTVAPSGCLADATAIMADRDVGILPVVEHGRLVGVVTDRDIAIRGVAQGLNSDAPVRQVMTGNLEYLYAEDDLDRAADKMASSQIRRLPVVDEDKHLVGMLSLGDLSREHKEKVVGRTLEDISEPARGGLSNRTTGDLSDRTAGDVGGPALGDTLPRV